MKLDELLESEYPRIRSYVERKLGRNDEHADDLAQVVFEKYLQLIEKSPARKNPSAWLMTVAHNECIQFFRNKKRDRHIICECDFAEAFKNDRGKITSLDELPQPQHSLWLLENNDGWEPWTEHLYTLKEFKEDARAAFVLFYPDILGKHFEAWLKGLFKPRMEKRILKANDKWPQGASIKQIARVLSVPQGTVTSNLSRVRAKLKPLFMKRILAEKAKRGAPIKYPKEFLARPLAQISRSRPSFSGSSHPMKFVGIMPPRDLPQPRSKPLASVAPAPAGKHSRRSEREKRNDSFQCGSAFKGCRHCGSAYYWGKCECGNTVQSRENNPVRCERPGLNHSVEVCGREIKLTRKIYDSGFDVWRSYSPNTTGWTYWCGTCGAKDQQCWENSEKDLGKEPRLFPSELNA